MSLSFAHPIPPVMEELHPRTAQTGGCIKGHSHVFYVLGTFVDFSEMEDGWEEMKKIMEISGKFRNEGFKHCEIYR